MDKKKHSRVEIATKLAQANELATQGKLQSEIARILGVSVMTLRRWARRRLASARIVGDPRSERARSHARRWQSNYRTPARKFTVAAAGDRSTSWKVKLEEAAQSQRSAAYRNETSIPIMIGSH